MAVAIREQGSHRVPVAITSGVGEWCWFCLGFYHFCFDYLVTTNHLVSLPQPDIGFSKCLLQALGRDLHFPGDNTGQGGDDVAAG